MRRKSVFLNYIDNNKKSLIFLAIIFIFGIIVGITFIDHANENQTQEISSYVISLKDNIKSSDHINQTVILKQSLKQNIIFVLIIWILGCTLLGSFLIYIAIAYKGFSIGYTISAVIATLGVKSRLYFCNVFFITSKFVFCSNDIYIVK